MHTNITLLFKDNGIIRFLNVEKIVFGKCFAENCNKETVSIKEFGSSNLYEYHLENIVNIETKIIE